MLPTSLLVRTTLSILASLPLSAVSGLAQTSLAQSATSTATVASRLTQPIDNAQLITLKGKVHPLARAANDRGAVDDGVALKRIQVSLKRSDAQETALKQLISDLHTTGTANYHKWLTPAQFGAQFGPSDADIAKLSAWFASQGFAVTGVTPGKQTLEMSGTAGQFRKAFHTPLHKYVVNGQTHYANATDPQIPAAAAAVFGGFASLNNFPLKSNAHRLGTATFDPSTHKATPSWTVGDSSGVSLVLAPGDFAVQYDLNPLYTAGTNGTGQTIAIINESNIDLTTVARFRSLFGLPASAPNVIIDGEDPGIDGNNNLDGSNGASVEAYLDVEEAGAVAPGATIDLVIAADTALQNGLALAAEHAVYSDVAPILSLSFGGCEAGTNNAFWNGLWEQAAAQGQTVLVSSGDAGSAGCDNDNSQEYAISGQAVNGLASSPWNVAVGGTDFYYSSYNGTNAALNAQIQQYWNLTPSNATPTTSLLQVIPEQPWNDSQYGLNLNSIYAEDGSTSIAGGGGGASTCATGTTSPTTSGSGGTCVPYPKPTFQAGPGVPADAARDLPDVSLFAANGLNASYYPVCASDGDCVVPVPASNGGYVQISGIGGTSASTPAFAGIMALVNQKYGRQGQADYILYPLAVQYPSAFHDVTNGTNSEPCAVTAISGYAPANCIPVAKPLTVTDPTYGTATEGQIGNTTTLTADYNATAGYDLASGLGTIDANNLVTNWGKVVLTSSSITLTPSSTSFAHGTSITISGTVAPSGSTGAVALQTDSTTPLQAVETAFALTNGTYSGTVSYLPGGTYNIFGSYTGDNADAPSTSSKTQITVTPEASTTALYALSTASTSNGSVSIANGASVPYGTQASLSAEPGPTSGATSYSTPTGSVVFADSGTTINTAQVNVEGDAEYNTAFAPGSHSVTAAYSGDSSYSASTSAPLAFTVVKDVPAIGLSTGSGQSSTALLAQSGTTTLTIQVENYANGTLLNDYGPYFVSPAVAPTGIVTLTGLPSGTLTFPALGAARDLSTNFPQGVALLALPTETAGTYTVTATYPGDANYQATTQTFPITISAAAGLATTTAVTSSATSTSSAAAVTVTTLITGQTNGGVPTGTLTYFSSGTNLGGLTLPATGTGDTNTASVSFNSETLGQGSNVITVQYSGSSTYAPSAGSVTVNNGGAVTTPGSLLLSNNAGITIASPGGSGSSTVTLTPGGGFTGQVTLSCTVSPTTNSDTPTCAVATPAAITGTTAVTATLTVSTTAATSARLTPALRLLPIGGGVALAGLFFFLAPARRRRLSTLLGAVVLVIGVGFSAGCGGSGPPQSATNPGTTAGSYTVTVTGSATGATIAPVTVAVTVQ